MSNENEIESNKDKLRHQGNVEKEGNKNPLNDEKSSSVKADAEKKKEKEGQKENSKEIIGEKNDWNKKEIFEVAAQIGTVIAALGTVVAVIISALALQSTNEALTLAKKSTDSADAATKQSLDISRKAAEAATQTAKVSESNYRLSKEAFDSTISANKKSGDFANKTFKESQRQFALESRPLLQISSISADSTNIKGSDPSYVINYSIVNFGKFPAKINSHQITSGWGFAPDHKKEMTMQTIINYEKLETYSASAYGNYFVSLSTPQQIIPIGQWIAYTKGAMNLYLVGEVTYESWMTKDRFKLSFIYRLHQNNKKLTVTGLKIEDLKY